MKAYYNSYNTLKGMATTYRNSNKFMELRAVGKKHNIQIGDCLVDKLIRKNMIQMFDSKTGLTLFSSHYNTFKLPTIHFNDRLQFMVISPKSVQKGIQVEGNAIIYFWGIPKYVSSKQQTFSKFSNPHLFPAFYFLVSLNLRKRTR